jgi:ubiquinone biosynthesis accessory factor UbiJ
MIDAPALAFIDHVLGREEWARERTRAHAGKRLHIRVGLIELHWRIDEEGLLRRAAASEAPDLHLGIPFAAWFGLARRDAAALREIAMEGDTELAETLQFLFLHCKWDIEEDLSRLVGDIAAHRIVNGGRAFFAWQRDAATRLGENLSEYWREEAGVLPTRSEVRAFVADVAALRDDVARLEKRLERHS